MRIRILGSAAGGGFPQWNCGCPNCHGVRTGTIAARPATQECTAVTSNGSAWVLLNASPDVRQQIESFSPLHPRGPRDTPVAAILLGNGDLDHCLGLLSLREWQPLAVYATERVRSGFTDGNALYPTLERFRGQVAWRRLVLGREERILDAAGGDTGLAVAAVAVPGKVPIHLEGRVLPDPEDNVGFRIHEPATGRVLLYFSAVGAITPSVVEALAEGDCVMLDGTFWSADELFALGLTRTATSMAHVPVGGPDGSLARLAGVGARRRLLTHLNNTNPLLRRDSSERATVEAQGWEVAEDGLEVTL